MRKKKNKLEVRKNKIIRIYTKTRYHYKCAKAKYPNRILYPIEAKLQLTKPIKKVEKDCNIKYLNSVTLSI